MRLQNIPNTTMVKPVFLPQFYEGGSTAVLIIHGYTGAPFEMSYLAERLNKAGFTVSVPRLPGHGTNGRDFLESGWKDWLRACVDAYLNLKAHYKTVYIIGLSMGGVLTILLAAKFKPEKITLAAPVVKVSDWRIRIAPLLGLFVKKLKKAEEEEFEDEDRKYLAREYWNYNFPGKAADLYHLQKMARKHLPEITSDTLIIASKEDETVPFTIAFCL